MRQTTTQKGFTLVELAIVMTIIGLLIGGILKGQELMQNARITSTVAQVRAYEAAVTTFRDKYDAVPGDMINANTRIPSCDGTAGRQCAPAAAVANGATPGDGIVGRPNPGAAWPTGTVAASHNTATTPVNVANSTSFETSLFWTHLLLSDLIGGVTNVSIAQNAVAAAWGGSHPAAKIAGGFVVANGDGTIVPGSGSVALTGPSGMVLILARTPTSVPTAVAGNILTPGRAAQIDRKMDDGLPSTGSVHGYGLPASCSVAGTGYLETVTATDCGLVVRIQG